MSSPGNQVRKMDPGDERHQLSRAVEEDKEDEGEKKELEEAHSAIISRGSGCLGCLIIPP